MKNEYTSERDEVEVQHPKRNFKEQKKNEPKLKSQDLRLKTRETTMMTANQQQCRSINIHCNAFFFQR